MYTNDHNQHSIDVSRKTCECQRQVFRAINDFISNHPSPYLGEGICIDICKECFEEGCSELTLRPEVSKDNPASDLAFTITIDSLAQDFLGNYELRISFLSPDDEDA